MRRTTFVICVIAVLLIASGATAATRYLITNVNQIKPSVRQQLKGNQGPRGFRGFTGATGLQGPQGAPGPQGAQGPPGVTHTTEVFSASTPISSGVPVNSATATCPAGSIVVGGGWTGLSQSTVYASEPSGNGWFVIADWKGGTTGEDLLQVRALCLS